MSSSESDDELSKWLHNHCLKHSDSRDSYEPSFEYRGRDSYGNCTYNRRREITSNANSRMNARRDGNVQRAIRQGGTEGTHDNANAQQLLRQATNTVNNMRL